MKKREREANVKTLNDAHELGIKLRAVHMTGGVVKREDVDKAATLLSLLAGFCAAWMPPADDEGEAK